MECSSPLLHFLAFSVEIFQLPNVNAHCMTQKTWIPVILSVSSLRGTSLTCRLPKDLQ